MPTEGGGGGRRGYLPHDDPASTTALRNKCQRSVNFMHEHGRYEGSKLFAFLGFDRSTPRYFEQERTFLSTSCSLCFRVCG